MRQPRSGLVPCGNLASSSIVEAKSALLRRFFSKIAIRPLPCFSSPTQTHFVGLCVGISVKRILSRIRLFCAYFVLKSGGHFSPTYPQTHGRGKCGNITQGLVLIEPFDGCFSLYTATQLVGESAMDFHIMKSFMFRRTSCLLSLQHWI